MNFLKPYHGRLTPVMVSNLSSWEDDLAGVQLLTAHLGNVSLVLGVKLGMSFRKILLICLLS